MEEIEIKVSTKVWVYCTLAMIVGMVALTGLRFYIDSNVDSAFLSLIFSMLTTIVIFGYFEFIRRRTRLIITDTTLTVNTQESWIVQFDGVDSFYVDKFKGHTFIGIRYKDNMEEAIADEDIAKNRKQRLKAALQGYPYEIYVKGLSKTPQEICDLLNSRIK
ncbi:MAG: hypothetical protein II404_11510 [Prevotella sp.]|nr:hypothetical protein [Prevotella sp.]